jgi:hypothetical protein
MQKIGHLSNLEIPQMPDASAGFLCYAEFNIGKEPMLHELRPHQYAHLHHTAAWQDLVAHLEGDT